MSTYTVDSLTIGNSKRNVPLINGHIPTPKSFSSETLLKMLSKKWSLK